MKVTILHEREILEHAISNLGVFAIKHYTPEQLHDLADSLLLAMPYLDEKTCEQIYSALSNSINGCQTNNWRDISAAIKNKLLQIKID